MTALLESTAEDKFTRTLLLHLHAQFATSDDSDPDAALAELNADLDRLANNDLHFRCCACPEDITARLRAAMNAPPLYPYGRPGRFGMWRLDRRDRKRGPRPSRWMVKCSQGHLSVVAFDVPPAS